MAAVTSERGWQAGKSLVECNRYMLDKQISCDITIRVQSPRGHAKVKAHKYMLIARSPVFQAMLCSDFKEAASSLIQVTDVDPQIFRCILEYLYTDEVSITVDNVLPLKYVSKKYLLDDLSLRCNTFLDRSMSVENAATILNNSITYGDEELIKYALKLITTHIQSFLSSEIILKLSQPALKMVLQQDELNFEREYTIFQAAMAWAKHHSLCKHPTDQDLRQTLGDCLLQIRFADIDQNKYPELSVLSDKEYRLFHLYSMRNSTPTHQYNHTKMELSNLGFNLEHRHSGLCILNRFSRTSGISDSYEGYPDAIDFSPNKTITLKGITLYGSGNYGEPIRYIDLQVFNGKTQTWSSQQNGELLSTGTTIPVPILLASTQVLEAGYQHTVQVTLAWSNPHIFYGADGQDVVEVDGVHFTFRDSSINTNFTDAHKGQIPGLIFSHIK